MVRKKRESLPGCDRCKVVLVSREGYTYDANIHFATRYVRGHMDFVLRACDIVATTCFLSEAERATITDIRLEPLVDHPDDRHHL